MVFQHGHPVPLASSEVPPLASPTGGNIFYHPPASRHPGLGISIALRLHSRQN